MNKPRTSKDTEFVIQKTFHKKTPRPNCFVAEYYQVSGLTSTLPKLFQNREKETLTSSVRPG